MAKIYYQPNHLWKGQKAVKKLKKLSGEKPKAVNPITYGILPFRQLRGGGLFGPDPENKVTVNGLI